MPWKTGSLFLMPPKSLHYRGHWFGLLPLKEKAIRIVLMPLVGRYDHGTTGFGTSVYPVKPLWHLFIWGDQRFGDDWPARHLSAIGFASGAPDGSRATLLRRVGRGSDVKEEGPEVGDRRSEVGMARRSG